jgi:hypothetical protein
MRAANGAAISVPISITLIALKGAVIAGYLMLFLEYEPRLEDPGGWNPTFSWQRAFAKRERPEDYRDLEAAIASRLAPTVDLRRT